MALSARLVVIALALAVPVSALGQEATAAPSAAAEQPRPPSPPPREATAGAQRGDGGTGDVSTFRARLRLETFPRGEPLWEPGASGSYELVERTVVPLYQQLDTHTTNLFTPGLDLHVGGFIAEDLAHQLFANRVVGDLSYGYLQYSMAGASALLGRQHVFSGAASGLHMDGLRVAYRHKSKLEAELLAGSPVTPAIGPEWYREGAVAVERVDFGRDGSYLNRFGDLAYGARVGYRDLGFLALGASLLETRDVEEVEKRVAALDAMMSPVDGVDVSGFFAFDLFEKRVTEATAAASFWPAARWELSLDYRYADPALQLSRLSLFSVFSEQAYNAAGLNVAYRPRDWLRVEAGLHPHINTFLTRRPTDLAWAHSTTELSYAADLKLVGQLDVPARPLAILETSRVTAEGKGYTNLWASVHVGIPPLEGLRAGADLYGSFFDEEVGHQRGSLLGGLVLSYATGDVTLSGAIEAGSTVFSRYEVRGSVSVAYSVERTR